MSPSHISHLFYHDLEAFGWLQCQTTSATLLLASLIRTDEYILMDLEACWWAGNTVSDPYPKCHLLTVPRFTPCLETFSSSFCDMAV